MLIIVKQLNGDSITLEVEETDSVRRIKEQIAKMIHIQVNAQRLYFKNAELDDNQTVSDCNLYNEMTIHLVQRMMSIIQPSEVDLGKPQQQSNINIFVRDGSDSVWKIEISPKSTVLMLKTVIEQKTPLKEITISFNGKILLEKDTLEKCELVDNSTINVSRRFGGGH